MTRLLRVAGLANLLSPGRPPPLLVAMLSERSESFVTTSSNPPKSSLARLYRLASCSSLALADSAAAAAVTASLDGAGSSFLLLQTRDHMSTTFTSNKYTHSLRPHSTRSAAPLPPPAANRSRYQRPSPSLPTEAPVVEPSRPQPSSIPFSRARPGISFATIYRSLHPIDDIAASPTSAKVPVTEPAQPQPSAIPFARARATPTFATIYRSQNPLPVGPPPAAIQQKPTRWSHHPRNPRNQPAKPAEAPFVQSPQQPPVVSPSRIPKPRRSTLVKTAEPTVSSTHADSTLSSLQSAIGSRRPPFVQSTNNPLGRPRQRCPTITSSYADSLSEKSTLSSAESAIVSRPPPFAHSTKVSICRPRQRAPTITSSYADSLSEKSLSSSPEPAITTKTRSSQISRLVPSFNLPTVAAAPSRTTFVPDHSGTLSERSTNPPSEPSFTSTPPPAKPLRVKPTHPSPAPTFSPISTAPQSCRRPPPKFTLAHTPAQPTPTFAPRNEDYDSLFFPRETRIPYSSATSQRPTIVKNDPKARGRLTKVHLSARVGTLRPSHGGLESSETSQESGRLIRGSTRFLRQPGLQPTLTKESVHETDLMQPFTGFSDVCFAATEEARRARKTTAAQPAEPLPTLIGKHSLISNVSLVAPRTLAHREKPTLRIRRVPTVVDKPTAATKTLAHREKPAPKTRRVPTVAPRTTSVQNFNIADSLTLPPSRDRLTTSPTIVRHPSIAEGLTIPPCDELKLSGQRKPTIAKPLPTVLPTPFEEPSTVSSCAPRPNGRRPRPTMQDSQRLRELINDPVVMKLPYDEFVKLLYKESMI
ncbi:hypothetical protein P154DRAFT_563338 [Amniculicola lignicola CBS 123094]|uniref:Uncharacterized protein n=1 Tax=Amniculicola lignicola CBS 123094 TaxID=1392246 RepID=A0A6A5WJG4_9PLEO|nr:hypothetical protein P154DRAFT_563338 [Amniculicola lignicola CBS 123094]